MDFKKYFSPIFASVTFFNFVFGDNVKANLKESFQKRSICSAENAEFEYVMQYEGSNYIYRYCITGENRIIQYRKKEKNARFIESSKTGFLGKKESNYSPINAFGAYQGTWYSDQWEIEEDQLILYSCSSVTSTDCSANVKRSVKAYKIGTLKHKNNSKIRLGYGARELTGVGIQIVKDKESDDLIIISLLEGTPAFYAGIKARDKILSIDDISTKGMNIKDAVKLIRGQRGTKVKLEILRGSESFFKILLREKILVKGNS